MGLDGVLAPGPPKTAPKKLPIGEAMSAGDAGACRSSWSFVAEMSSAVRLPLLVTCFVLSVSQE